MQYTLTSNQTGYISRRVQACDVDDITQSVLIRLWQIDTCDGLPADPTEREHLTWTIVRGKVTDHHRRSGRTRCDSLGDYDPAERTADDHPEIDIDSLLRHAGSCADAIRRAYLGDNTTLSETERRYARRGIERIRTALGISHESCPE